MQLLRNLAASELPKWIAIQRQNPIGFHQTRQKTSHEKNIAVHSAVAYSYLRRSFLLHFRC